MTTEKTKRKFKSKSFQAIHSAAEGLFNTGGITKETMRDFDDTCLTVPKPLAPTDIKRLRESYQVSQPVFAKYLNTSQSTIEKWEIGAKHPHGAALKLLNVVQKHGLEILR
ncbi:DNA-binding transcriptional regulator [soil metagenome]